MQGNEYQKLAMRTNDKKAYRRLYIELTGKLSLSPITESNAKCSNINDIAGLLNGVLGLTGEAGEVSDLVKKGIFHEKGIDLEHLKKECGDVMWYVAMICEACGFSLDDVMQTNIDKLIARYPDGFDSYRANHRQAGDV